MNKKNPIKIAIIGSGAASKRLLDSIFSSKKLISDFIPVGIFDDDKSKIHSSLNGVQVFDSIKNIYKYSELFDQIVIAIPSCTQSQFKKIHKHCLKANKHILTVPSYGAILNQTKPISSVRDINIQDLIHRKEMPINYNNIIKTVKNKTILITGGAGSIGSVILQLCLDSMAKKVICIDNSEYSTYLLTQNINSRRFVYKTADIKDKRIMEFYFQQYKPDIVFQAAALKHVNLQENDIRNCILTNFFGTKNIIELCDQYNISDFVFISTDKAVEPSNNMGLSKRLAELLVKDFSNFSNTNMSIVRFGNVIGSSGSVLNLFSQLINDRKDIIITHPKVARFFMSIEEACYLVLESLGIRKNGCQIFMIDMGEEILIKDIAETLIYLNNLKPNKDIKIKFDKLKKGEKISEKLKYNFEKSEKTNINKLLSLSMKKEIKIDDFESFTKDLNELIYQKNISSKKIHLFIVKKLKNFL